MGRRVKDGNYTSLKDSSLANFITKLKPIIHSLQMVAKDSKKKLSLESQFTAKQLAALEKVIEVVQEVGPEFENGNKPNIVAFGFNHGLKLRSMETTVADLRSVHHVIYYQLKNELPSIVESAYKTAKQKTKDPHDFPAVFKQVIKSAITQKLDNFNKTIPCKNLTPYLYDLDAAINSYDVSSNGADAKKLIAWLKMEFLKDKQKYDLRVVHEASYELVAHIFTLIDEVPAELEDLLSFLNPAMVNFSVGTLGIKHLKPMPGSSGDFTYDIGKGPEDYEQYYREYRKSLSTLLSAHLIAYFNDYNDTPHVRSEQAKMSLIERFIQAESKLFEERVNLVLQNLVKTEERSSTDDLEGKLGKINTDQFNTIPDDTIQLEQLITLIEHDEITVKTLLEDITQKLADYKQLAFQDLLKSHSTLAEQLELDKKLVNTTYANLPLPEKLLLQRANGFVLAGIQDELAMGLGAQKEKLENIVGRLQQNKEKLILQYHEKENKKLSHKVKALAQNISDISILQISDTTNIDIMEQHSVELVSSKLKLSQLLDEVDTLQRSLGNLYCPVNLRQQIYSSIVTSYDINKEQLAECKRSLLKTKELLKNQENELTVSLERARATQAFEEKMRSANTKELLELKLQKEKLLAEGGQEENRIRRELETLQTNKSEENIDPLGSKDPLIGDKSRRARKIQILIDSLETHKAVLERFRPHSEEEFNVLFTPQKLESSEATFALKWMELLIKELDLGLEDQETRLKEKLDFQQLTHKALLATYTVIEKAQGKNKGKALLQEVEQLQELNALKTMCGFSSKKGNCGVAILAKILEGSVDNELQKQIISGDLKNLLSQMDGQLLPVTSQIATLNEIQKDIILYQENKTGLVTFNMAIAELVLINKHIEEREEAIALEKQEMENKVAMMEMKLSEIHRANDTLAIEINLLDKANFLFRGIRNLNELINSNKEVEIKCMEAENQLMSLAEELVNLKNVVDSSSTTTTDYTASASIIASLLTAAGQRILQMRVNLFKEKFEALSEARESFSNEPQARLLLIKTNVEQFNSLCELIQPSFAQINALCSQLAKLGDKENETPQGLESIVKAHQGRLIEDIKLSLQAYQEGIETQRQNLTLTFDKTSENHESCKQVIEQVSMYASSITASDLDSLKTAIEKLLPESRDTLSVLANAQVKALELNKQLEASKKTLSEQANYISTRKDKVAEFLTVSNDYLLKRKEKYAFKDFFSSADFSNRTQFIQDLSVKLQQYVKTGDSQPVLDYIAQEKGKFFGLTLLPMLRRLVIDIKVIDKTDATDTNNATIESTIKLTVLHQQAKQAKDNLKLTSPELCKALDGLYIKISKLHQHGKKIADTDGDVAMKLAVQLREKVDKMIIQHSKSNKQVTTSEFNAFHADFVEHLHSQDDIMSKHRSFWKPFIANVAAALFTVGIALGVKLLSSKILTGHASFFGETKRFQHVQGLDAAISKAVVAVTA